MRTLTAIWTRYWFADGSATNLAVARVLAAGIALWILLSRDFAAVHALPAPFWAGVESSSLVRYLVVPGSQGLDAALMWVARLSALGALVGLLPRVSSFVTALLLYHLAPLESIVWTTSPNARGLTLPLLVLLVCAVTPSGDVLSLGKGRAEVRSSASYGWPVRLIQFQVAMVYVLSGVAKVAESGLAWTSSDNLRNWMLLAVQNEDVAVHGGVGAWIASRGGLTGAVGIGTLLFELGFLAALVRWRGRVFFAVAALLFHGLIYFAMNITLQSWPLLLVFIDWGALGRGRRAGREAPA